MATSTAYLMTQRALMDVPSENVEEVRAQSLMVLDEAEVVALQAMRSQHKVISQTGRVVLDDETHEPVCDAMPNLAAIDKVLKIEDPRARLVGTYAPRKQLINVVTEEALVAKRDELLAELERRGQPCGRRASTRRRWRRDCLSAEESDRRGGRRLCGAAVTSRQAGTTARGAGCRPR